MKMWTSHGVLVLFYLGFNFTNCFKHHLYKLDSSFIQGNVLDTSSELSEVFLSELEVFNSKVLEKLADRLLVLFNDNGFDLNDEKNVETLYNFLEEVNINVDEDPLTSSDEAQVAKPSFRSRLLSGLKKAAIGVGKEALLHATKAVIAFGVKESLPEIERITKSALNRLPVQLKVAVAPLVFKLWSNLFKRAHVTPPKDFTLKHIIFDGLSESDRLLAKDYLD